MSRAKWQITCALLLLITLTANACVPAGPAPTTAPTEQPAAAPTEQMAAPTQEAPTPAPPEEQVVLKVMDNWGNQADAKGPPLTSIFEDFMKAYPNIKIEEEVFADSEIPTKVETAFLAGEEPDLVFQNYGLGTLKWLDDGVAIPVTDLIQEWGLKDTFKEEAIREYTDSEGRIASFPLEGFTWPVWYNVKILKEAGVSDIPKTIDELIEASDKVRAAGYQPLVVGGSDWTGQALWDVIKQTVMTDQEAGEAYQKDNFANNEKFVKAVELFVKLRDAGVFVDNSEGLEFATMNEMFFSGKAAMMHAGAWSFGECPEELRQDVVVSGFPLPSDTPRMKPVVPTGYVGKGIWITRNGAKKIDAVEKFVTFFYQPDMIARFVEQAGMTSPLKETPVDESKLNSLFAQTLNWGDSVEYIQVMDLYIPPKAWEDLWRATKQMYLPSSTVDQILTTFDQAWQPYTSE
jgi:multiple sugar transport system substrate-binding protein